MNKEIISEMKTIRDVMLNNDNIFFIPDFQRNFVWGAEEVTQLFFDFGDDTNNYNNNIMELEGYLLGNIVLINEGDQKKIVVDGQQRLTTLSLIFKALMEVLMQKIDSKSGPDKYKWVEKIADLKKGYVHTDEFDNEQGLRITHDPSLAYGTAYKCIINSLPYSAEMESDAKLQGVYDQAYEIISSFDDIQIERFINYMKNKVKLIVTSAPSLSKAFQLFEVLNDRGKSLEPMDLIKNVFLKTLNIEGRKDHEVEEFKTNWAEFLKNLQVSSKRSIASSTFMKHFLIAEYGVNIKQANLFDFFGSKKPLKEKRELNGKEILDIARKMKNYSKIYSQIEQENYGAFHNHHNMYILFKIFGLRQLHPLLMVFYEEKNEEKKAIILDLALRFGVAVLYSFTQTNYIESEITKLIYAYISHKDKEIAFTELNNAANDLIKQRLKIVSSILPTKDFTSSTGGAQTKAFSLLKFIELYFNNNPNIKSPEHGKKITVEHILSREIDKSAHGISGFSDNVDFKDHVNLIGNLTLLYNNDNSHLKNAIFEDKIQVYAASKFIMTNTIIGPLTTTHKNGMDTKKYALINKYEKQYYTLDKKYWHKSNIIDRGKDITSMVNFICSNTEKI